MSLQRSPAPAPKPYDFGYTFLPLLRSCGDTNRRDHFNSTVTFSILPVNLNGSL